MTSDAKYEVLKEFIIGVIAKQLNVEVEIEDPRLLADLDAYKDTKDGRTRYVVNMKAILMEKNDYDETISKLKEK